MLQLIADGYAHCRRSTWPMCSHYEICTNGSARWRKRYGGGFGTQAAWASIAHGLYTVVSRISAVRREHPHM